MTPAHSVCESPYTRTCTRLTYTRLTYTRTCTHAHTTHAQAETAAPTSSAANSSAADAAAADSAVVKPTAGPAEPEAAEEPEADLAHALEESALTHALEESAREASAAGTEEELELARVESSSQGSAGPSGAFHVTPQALMQQNPAEGDHVRVGESEEEMHPGKHSRMPNPIVL